MSICNTLCLAISFLVTISSTQAQARKAETSRSQERKESSDRPAPKRETPPARETKPAVEPARPPQTPVPAPAKRAAPEPKTRAIREATRIQDAPQARPHETRTVVTPTPAMAQVHPAPAANTAPSVKLPSIPNIPRRESAELAPVKSPAIPLRASVEKKPLPTLRWKEANLPEKRIDAKPTIPAVKVAPKTLAPHFERRFLPQLPKPIVREAEPSQAPGFQTKTKKAKGFWTTLGKHSNHCLGLSAGCTSCKSKRKNDCIWIGTPFVYWIPYSVFFFTQSVEVLEIPAPFEESMALDLQAVEKAVRLGDLYFRAGKFDKAAAAYMEAVSLAPQEAELYFLLSDALFAIGDYHFAAYCIRTALEIEPSLAYSKADKREFYGERDFFYRHLRLLERYLQEYDDDADAQLVLGYNRLFSDDPSGARRAFRRTIEIQEDPAAALFLESFADR